MKEKAIKIDVLRWEGVSQSRYEGYIQNSGIYILGAMANKSPKTTHEVRLAKKITHAVFKLHSLEWAPIRPNGAPIGVSSNLSSTLGLWSPIHQNPLTIRPHGMWFARIEAHSPFSGVYRLELSRNHHPFARMVWSFGQIMAWECTVASFKWVMVFGFSEVLRDDL